MAVTNPRKTPVLDLKTGILSIVCRAGVLGDKLRRQAVSVFTSPKSMAFSQADKHYLFADWLVANLSWLVG